MGKMFLKDPYCKPCKTNVFCIQKQLLFFHFLRRSIFFYRVSSKTTDSSKVTVSGCKIGQIYVLFSKKRLRFFLFFEQNVISDSSDVRNFRFLTFWRTIWKIRPSKCDQMIKTVVFSIIFLLRNEIQPLNSLTQCISARAALGT